MKEGTDLPNPFADRSPKELARLYVEKMNELFASTDEKGSWMQLDPDTAGEDFVPDIEISLLKSKWPTSGFQAILLRTSLIMTDRVEAARARGIYDTDASSALIVIGNIVTFLNDHPEAKTKWLKLDLANFVK